MIGPDKMLPEDDSDVTPEVAAAAFRLLMRDFPGPARAEAERRIRATLIEEFRAAGQNIPEWLQGPAAKAFLDDLAGRE